MLLIYVLCLIHDITKNLFFYLLLFPHRGFKKKQGWYFVQNICIEYTTKYNVQLLKSQSFIFLKFRQCMLIFTCAAEGESRSRSAVTPSVCPPVCPSVHPKILSSQLLWNYWSNYHETWYVVMHIGRKFWSPHFCWSYALWNLENTHKWPCHRNSSETTDLIFMKLSM